MTEEKNNKNKKREKKAKTSGDPVCELFDEKDKKFGKK